MLVLAKCYLHKSSIALSLFPIASFSIFSVHGTEFKINIKWTEFRIFLCEKLDYGTRKSFWKRQFGLKGTSVLHFESSLSILFVDGEHRKRDIVFVIAIPKIIYYRSGTIKHERHIQSTLKTYKFNVLVLCVRARMQETYIVQKGWSCGCALEKYFPVSMADSVWRMVCAGHEHCLTGISHHIAVSIAQTLSKALVRMS